MFVKNENILIMNKILILAIGLFIISSQSLLAQPMFEMDQVGEKYYAQKVAYLTSVMELTPDESAAFWPIYNEYEKKKSQLNENMKEHRQDAIHKGMAMSEDEALQMLKYHQQHMNEMHHLEIDYQNKYLKVISAKKVLLLLKAEKDFRRDLLKQLGERRRMRNN